MNTNLPPQPAVPLPAGKQDLPFPSIGITFSPAWWYARYQMDFSRESWLDPIARTERDLDQRRLLFERFGNVGLGEAHPLPHPQAGEEWGHRLMAAFWGCPVVYPPNQSPSEVSVPQARQRMENLEIPNIETSPVVGLILENARLLKEHYGHCQASFNYGGPLNNAVSVFGQEMLTICASEPELAQHVLQKMGEAILLLHDQVACRVNEVDPATARAGNWGIGNCPVCMLSPEMYRDLVLPVDLWYRRQFKGEFNLHHCGRFHPYAGVYQALEPGSLDLGQGTDLSITRAAYPQARISTYIDPWDVSRMNRAEMDALVTQLIKDTAPVELFAAIQVAEVGPEVSDDTVRNWMTVKDRLNL